MKSRFRPIVLPGGRAAGAPTVPRLSRTSLRILPGSAEEVERALVEAIAEARRMREEAEQRRARSFESAPDDSH